MNNQTETKNSNNKYPWLTDHVHSPNSEPESQDPTIQLCFPDNRQSQVNLPLLHMLPTVSLTNCYIISTGHGTSGPFTFTGVRLEILLEHCLQHRLEKPLDLHWDYVDVISIDGFGTRIFAHEVRDGAIILAYQIDGIEMTRSQGLVRLIVPTEQDDALRQVKWVTTIVLGYA